MIWLIFLLNVRNNPYVKKNWKSYPENWKIGEKLKVVFCDGYALSGQLQRKSKNSGKLQKL
jgi:hypothetical protein